MNIFIEKNTRATLHRETKIYGTHLKHLKPIPNIKNFGC